MTDDNKPVTPGSNTPKPESETPPADNTSVNPAGGDNPGATDGPGAGATGHSTTGEGTTGAGTTGEGAAGASTTGATAGTTHQSAAGTPSKKPWGMDLNIYCMLLHLSQLAGFVFPGLGLVLPIVMWATNKDEFPAVNLHGLIVLNWILSAVIYFVAFFILSFILIGIPLMFALAVVALVFAVIGGIKANDGKYWPYPLSIDFFGVKKKLPAEH